MFPCKRSGAVEMISGTVPLTREHQSAFLNVVESCFGNGQPRVVFDLAQIPLMDSVGMESLLEARDRCLLAPTLFAETFCESMESIESSTSTMMLSKPWGVSRDDPRYYPTCPHGLRPILGPSIQARPACAQGGPAWRKLSACGAPFPRRSRGCSATALQLQFTAR
jgi:hypothetical protein